MLSIHLLWLLFLPLTFSAKQGLLAKAAQDGPRLRRSKLPELESLLAQAIVCHHQQLAGHTAIGDVLRMMQSTRDNLKQRLFSADKELEELQQQPTDEAFLETLDRQRQHVKEQQGRFHRLSLSLRSHQKQLAKHHRQLEAKANPQRLEELITETQTSMRNRLG